MRLVSLVMSAALAAVLLQDTVVAGKRKKSPEARLEELEDELYEEWEDYEYPEVAGRKQLANIMKERDEHKERRVQSGTGFTQDDLDDFLSGKRDMNELYIPEPGPKMMYAKFDREMTRDELEDKLRLFARLMRTGGLGSNGVIIDKETLLFSIMNGFEAPKVKDFLLAQDGVVDVIIDNRHFYKKGYKPKPQEGPPGYPRP
eukprot:TRINITY_DN3873_c0_g1_i1.p2 TRINITY_DN3873_c0_g1~~TRINITY_DN3873_c0_g1_i1.p2  ORF type:complete len:212 (-),score=58.10 TRINITY_DN3873_c0_g1_i1:33-638(-)